MSLSSLSSANLRNLVTLVEKREALAAELEKVEASIKSALEGGKASTPIAGAKRGPKKGSIRRPKMNKRGALRDFIVAELQAAGKEGVSVKDLSAKLGVKNQNVHVWFSTTGKSVGAKRVSPGRYAL
ncbi:MAG: hypothetical protein BGO12_21375 [Verrucomicrobia bacterium 61-8]|nr:hypothetical protein [Verrucomicrobiota bacterium]OJU98046.1 MAG: hypothetical protein BGO12_21375 [Verrucomicrobia bacterium 61-8]